MPTRVRTVAGRAHEVDGGGAPIRRTRWTAGIAGLAAGALAAGAIASAVLSPGPSIENIIAAGHLRIEVNHGQSSDLDFANLAPGESRTGDQLISADMAGIGAADLVLTLSGAHEGPFADHASLAVSVSDPAPAASLQLTDGECRPTQGYEGGATFRMAALTSAHQVQLGSLTSTDTTVCVRYTVTLDAAADNSVQNASASLNLGYGLTQIAVSSP